MALGCRYLSIPFVQCRGKRSDSSLSGNAATSLAEGLRCRFSDPGDTNNESTLLRQYGCLRREKCRFRQLGRNPKRPGWRISADKSVDCYFIDSAQDCPAKAGCCADRIF